MTTVTDTLDVAAKLAAESDTFWTGHSGEQATGEDTARHLDAVRELLERDGWVRHHGNDDPDVEFDDSDSASVKNMLRQIIRAIREFVGVDKRRTLWVALMHVAASDDGDDDTQLMAERSLDVILRARTGARFASHSAWASKLGRTWEEVSDLLADAARFARTHGPAA